MFSTISVRQDCKISCHFIPFILLKDALASNLYENGKYVHKLEEKNTTKLSTYNVKVQRKTTT